MYNIGLGFKDRGKYTCMVILEELYTLLAHWISFSSWIKDKYREYSYIV